MTDTSNVGTGGGAGGSNTDQASATEKRARTGDQTTRTAATAPASESKTDLINRAREGLDQWFNEHFRASNELSQDTQLHNAVHGSMQSIQGLLGERAG
jgi:hypothetical protein